MTDKLRKMALGALATLLGLAPLGCASAAPPAGTPAGRVAPELHPCQGRRGPLPLHLSAAPLPARGHPQRDHPHRDRPAHRARHHRALRGQDRRRRRHVAPAGAARDRRAASWSRPASSTRTPTSASTLRPASHAHADGNEVTGPNTAEVWAEHRSGRRIPASRARCAGGVTTLQILPGLGQPDRRPRRDAEDVPARTVQGMKFPGAPDGLKMACGENPKRVYGGKRRAPSTRMGNVAGYRAAVDQRAPSTAASGTLRARRRRRTRRPTRPTRDLSSRRWPACCAARSWSRTTATAPTRWRRCSTSPRSWASRSAPSTTPRGLQDPRPAGARTTSASPPGRTGGASSWRPSTASRRTSRSCTEAGALRIIHSDTRRHPAPQPGGRQGDGAPAGAAGIDDHAEARRCAGSPRTRPGRSASTTDRHARAGQDGRRGDLERQPVQRLRPRRARSTSTARWSTTARTRPASRAATSSWASAMPAIARRSNDAPPDSLCPSSLFPSSP